MAAGISRPQGSRDGECRRMRTETTVNIVVASVLCLTGAMIHDARGQQAAPQTRPAAPRWYDSYAVSATLAEGGSGGSFGSSTLWLDLGADRASTPERRLGYHLCAYSGLSAAAGEPFSLDQLAHDACDANVTALLPVGCGLECACGKWTNEYGSAMSADRPTWDESGGLVFDYALAPAPAGVKARLALGDRGGLSGQVVRGWHGADATFASTGYVVGGDVAPSATTMLSGHYMTGADLESALSDARLQVADVSAQVAASPRLALAATYTAARGRQAAAASEPHWWSAAVYTKWDWRSGATLSARVERFADQAGYATGEVQHLDAVTLTHEAQMREGFTLRAALRQTTAELPMFAGRHGASRHDLAVNLAVQAELTTGGGD